MTGSGGPLRRRYGSGPAQFGDFYAGRPPCRRPPVVLVHGGFWRPHRSLDMTAPLAEELASRGWNVWNVEYRRGGEGGWPATLDDCAAAVDHLAVLGAELSLDLRSALAIGHSAGGQLAVWLGGRAAAAARAGRPAPAVRVAGVVAVAGVLDLEHAARARVGEDAVTEFVGGVPDELPQRYREASPTSRLPTGVAVRCVHSREDERVPFEQSVRYVEAARRAGDDASLVEVGGAHADGIDPARPPGERVVNVIEALDGP